MGIAVRSGVILALSVSLLQAVLIGAGLHMKPVGAFIGFIVTIVLNVAIVFFALRKTAPTNAYVEQLLSAIVIGAVGGALVCVLSLVMSSFVFPELIDEVKAARIASLEEREMADDLRERFVESTEAMTGRGQAFAGMIGTFFTSLIVGAIVALFQRESTYNARR